ncbi:hypothetical protein [Achromobacter xylosoxidans]|uniref:hypothetical protein n=1 Tax=Alcaligenes xylosoxydans xylosoxydans TaxID=85698 RepID=UPI0022B891D9|nr:hypothetical protein [Achromobacter xylosoxidans]MCZ8384140.1 hypothetical protein [Achromobacter xylosoxidans]
MLSRTARKVDVLFVCTYQEISMTFIVAQQAAESAEALERGAAGKVEKKKPRREVEWSVTHKMRLPHKVGMPLGSGGSGDDAST